MIHSDRVSQARMFVEQREAWKNQPASTDAVTGPRRARPLKSICHVFGVVMLGGLCSGCLLRLEHNTTSPGARGVVLDYQTRAPVSGADVVVSRLCIGPPIVSDALTNTRPPVVTTAKSGRFSVRAERHWDVVCFLVERFRTPSGTLVVQRAGYEPAAIPLWMQRTNFIEVLLSPVTK